MKNIRAFVFDLDGTLVTSTLDFTLIRSEVGCPEEMDLLTYVEGLADEDRAAAHAIIHRHEVQDAESSEWLPGAKEFVQTCRARGIPLAILTRNSDYTSRIKIAKNRIPIPYLYTRENSKPKPDPTALQQIARAFRLESQSVLMVGDYKYDLQAGRNAQMPTCLINYEGTPDYLEMADFKFQDFGQLHSAYFEGR